MTRRELIQAVQADIKSGKDRRQVFESYQPQFPKTLQLATVIAGTAREEAKQQYGLLNKLLVGLLVLGGISKVLTVWAVVGGTTMIGAVALSVIALLISCAFAYEVNRYTGAMYGLITILSGVSLLNVLLSFAAEPIGSAILIVFLGAILALSVILRQKLFPALQFFGVKKDGNGQYQLG